MQLVINGLLLGGIYALLSIGLTMIFGVLEIINFAHGEFLMISMYATFWLFQGLGIDPYISLFIIIPSFFLLGVLVEQVIIKPMLNDPPLNQIFSTIGLGLIFQNLALLFFKADFRTVKTSYSSTNIFLGDLIVSIPRLIAFIVAVTLIAGLFLFLKKTFTGKAIRAAGATATSGHAYGDQCPQDLFHCLWHRYSLRGSGGGNNDATLFRVPYCRITFRIDRLCCCHSWWI